MIPTEIVNHASNALNGTGDYICWQSNEGEVPFQSLPTQLCMYVVDLLKKFLK